MPADLVRRRLIVSGRVQGVFFRDSTRRKAQASAHAVKIDAGQGWKGQEITEMHFK